MYKVLEKVLRDLKENRRFDSLREEINNIAKQQQGERNLKASARMWHNQAEQLRELLESDGRANEDDRLRTIRLAQETDAQVDQALFLNSGKLGRELHTRIRDECTKQFRALYDIFQRYF